MEVRMCWFRMPRALTSSSGRGPRSLRCSLGGLWHHHANLQQRLPVFLRGLGRWHRGSEPSKVRGWRLWVPTSATSHFQFLPSWWGAGNRGACSLLWEMNKPQCQVCLNLGFNPNKILLWKATSLSCYFLVVHSRIALIVLKPKWPLALNGERSREKAGKILAEAKSLVAHGLFFTLPLLSTAFLGTWSYWVGKTQVSISSPPLFSSTALGKLNRCLPW